MNPEYDLSTTVLEEKERSAVIDFCGHVQDVLGEHLESIAIFGSVISGGYRPGRGNINLLIVPDRVDIHVMKAIHDPLAKYRKFRIDPFIVTMEDIRSSADVFPVKFMIIKESCRVLFGKDVMADFEIRKDHLRLRCEQELKNILLRLRRHYIVSGGWRLTEMMTKTIDGFLENLRFVYSLSTGNLPDRDAIIDLSAAAFGLDLEIIMQLDTLRDREMTLDREEAEHLYAGYLDVVEKVARIADKLEAE